MRPAWESSDELGMAASCVVLASARENATCADACSSEFEMGPRLGCRDGVSPLKTCLNPSGRDSLWCVMMLSLSGLSSI